MQSNNPPREGAEQDSPRLPRRSARSCVARTRRDSAPAPPPTACRPATRRAVARRQRRRAALGGARCASPHTSGGDRHALRLAGSPPAREGAPRRSTADAHRHFCRPWVTRGKKNKKNAHTILIRRPSRLPGQTASPPPPHLWRRRRRTTEASWWPPAEAPIRFSDGRRTRRGAQQPRAGTTARDAAHARAAAAGGARRLWRRRSRCP